MSKVDSSMAHKISSDFRTEKQRANVLNYWGDGKWGKEYLSFLSCGNEPSIAMALTVIKKKINDEPADTCKQ